MKEICHNIQKIKKKLPPDVTLVAVSKTKPVSDILDAYNCYQRHFGENKVQELVNKYEKLPKDINWHMIGHLQRNKVKYIVPFVYLIHGVDNLKLLQEIEKQAAKINRIVNVLLQIKIARETTKFGMNEELLSEIVNLYQNNTFTHIQLKGLMGMATHTTDSKQIAGEFRYLHQLFEKYNRILPEFTYLSMGMSGDYPIAVANGSNLIRIGSAVFGARTYM